MPIPGAGRGQDEASREAAELRIRIAPESRFPLQVVRADGVPEMLMTVFAHELRRELAPGSAYNYVREVVRFANWAAGDGVRSSLSDLQADLLREHFKAAMLMLDGDAAGWAATETIIRRLSPLMKVSAISMRPGVQPDQLAPKEISGLLSGVRQQTKGWER